MQALQRTFEQIGRQLRDLPATAKLLVGALAVILVLALVIVAQAAGRRDFVALGVSADAPPEVRARIVAHLEATGIPHEPRGNEIMVPAARKVAVLGELAASRVIGTDQIDFDKLLGQEWSPWEDRRTAERKFLLLKMDLLSRIVAGLEGVDRAKVVISRPDRAGGFGRSADRSTATVTVWPATGRVNRRLADAVAHLIAGSESGLDADRVAVIDAVSMTRVALPSPGVADAGEFLAQKEATEAHFRSKLENSLGIPGALVEVNAQIDPDRVESKQVEVSEPKVGVTRERSKESATRTERAAAAPGVRANAADAVARGAGSLASSESADSDAASINAFPYEERHRVHGVGEPMRVDAAIRVPRSWLVGMHRLKQGPDAEDPDEAAIDAIFAAEMPKILETVENLIRTDAFEGAIAGKVTVNTFVDLASMAVAGVPGFEGAGGGATASGSGSLLAGGLVRTAGLVALAGISLLLMFMMVRRASRPEELPSPEELVGLPPTIGDESDLVGEAGESAASLVGVEVSEDEVRRHRMLEQINELAKAHPDEAATLVRRWMRTDTA